MVEKKVGLAPQPRTLASIPYQRRPKFEANPVEFVKTTPCGQEEDIPVPLWLDLDELVLA